MTDNYLELRARLSEDALSLLDCDSELYSEWATACAIAMHALNVGMTEGEFITVVSASEFAHRFATESGRDRAYRVESRLRKVWNQAEDGWNPPVGGIAEVRQQLAELSQRLEGPWYGRTANSNRVVSLALVAKAHEVGTWKVDVSERELSIRAGVARATVHKALQRLADLGIISRDESTPRSAGHAQRWVIDLGWNRDSGLNRITSPYWPYPPKGEEEKEENLCGLTLRLNHPVFLRSALGQTAERIWFDLIENPGSTTADIASRLGMSADTVRRNMEKKLIPNGMVLHSVKPGARKGRPAVVYDVDPTADLDRIAAEYGVLDWEERTAQRYEDERHGFRVVQQQRAARQAAMSEIPEEPDDEYRRRLEEESSF